MQKLVLFLGILGVNLLADLSVAEETSRTKWDKKYSTNSYISGTDPIDLIKDNLDKIPKGKVLDLAMGEGRNAVFLAKQGYEVEGIDISTVGVSKAQRLAANQHVKIKTLVADLENFKIAENSYDVIIVSYYLQRSLFPQIVKALKSNGVVVFETFNEAHAEKNPSFNKEFLLKKNELEEAFKGFNFLVYEESKKGSTVTKMIAKKVVDSRSLTN